LKTRKKPKVGIFSLTSCAGCQLSILFIRDILMEVLDKMEIIHFPAVMEYNEEGPFDIALVEGAVTRKDEIDRIKNIRKKSKILIALGTCATYGGIPSMRDLGYLPEEEIRKAVYEDTSTLGSTENVYGINQYVEVDYFLRGCPPIPSEFIKTLKDLLLGKIPRFREIPVCVECRSKGNPCLLQMGEPCLGPVTWGGCDALCPTEDISCYGCRGPLEEPNVDALVKILYKKGLSKDDIGRMFGMFAGTSKKFVKVRCRER